MRGGAGGAGTRRAGARRTRVTVHCDARARILAQKMLQLLLAVVCFATLCSTAPAKTGSMPKGAMLWVYRCDDNATNWQELVQYLADVAKPAGVTSVSLCAYRIKADGSFGYRASLASVFACRGSLAYGSRRSRHTRSTACSFLH